MPINIDPGYHDLEILKRVCDQIIEDHTISKDWSAIDELFKDKRIGKIMLKIEKLEILKDCSSVGIQITKKRSHDKF